MPKLNNPIQKQLLKQSRLNGNTGADALRAAGFAETTATHNVGECTLLKTVDKEIMQELKAKDVSVDMVLSRLNEDRNLAKLKGDIATMAKIDELLGKFLAMFTERKEISATLMTNEEISILNKYIIDIHYKPICNKINNKIDNTIDNTINNTMDNTIDNTNILKTPERNSGVGVG